MLRYTVPVFLVLALACGGRDDKPGGLFDDTGGSTLDRDEDDDGSPDREDCADNDPTVFPGADEIPYDGIDNDCDAGTPDDDLDGDGYGLAEDCDDQAAAVHPGATEIQGDGIDNDCDPNTCLNPGFSASANAWSLPDEDFTLASQPFGEFADDNSCANGIPEFVVMDMNADGVLDLVILGSPCSDTSVGQDHWDVYLGGLSGFAADPTRWALPYADYPVSQPFAEPVDDNSCADGIPEFVVMDMNGDRVPDLLVLDSPCSDTDLGRSHWDVYEGGASGFAITATRYNLPQRDYPGTSPFIELVDNNDCAAGIPEHVVMDMTGDGLPDIVVLQSPCADGALGQTHWDVYAGTPTGFAPPAISWALPTADYPGAAHFIEILDDNDCASGNPEFVTTDLTGDGVPELVVLQAPCADDDLGRSHWDVYAGGAAGFASSASTWALPQGDYPGTAPFIEIADTNDCASGRPQYVVTDMAGDGVPDLTVIQSPCADDDVGRSEWRVYAGDSGGFSSSAASWSLPLSDFPGAVFPFAAWGDNNDCSNHEPEFVVSRLNDDDIPDLIVIQSPCADTTVGRDHWSVYFGTCDL